MDFALDPEQIQLAEAVQRFCAGPSAADPAAQAELGLTGLLLPAAQGGSALGAVETMLVAQELGRALDRGRWLADAVLAAPLLAALASPAQAATWLPALARGELRVALAIAEPQARYEPIHVTTRAEPQGGGWQLHGRKALVLGGPEAELLLVLARTEGAPDAAQGLRLCAVPARAPGVQWQPHALLDGRPAAALVLQGVGVSPDQQLGTHLAQGTDPGSAISMAIEVAVDRASAALCADSAGALAALLAHTVAHLRDRRQFGKPLASFQALQHRVADMALALEQMKSMACAAAMGLQAESARERQRLVSAAATLCAQLGRQQAFVAIQLHGAMGMTDECRASHYARRLIANGLLFGDAAHHLDRFARAGATPCAQPEET